MGSIEQRERVPVEVIMNHQEANAPLKHREVPRDSLRWFEGPPMTLDLKLSELLRDEKTLNSENLQAMFRRWATEDKDAGHFLLTIRGEELRDQTLGFLTADLEEDGRDEETKLFWEEFDKFRLCL
jgi:hypothetical protein